MEYYIIRFYDKNDNEIAHSRKYTDYNEARKAACNIVWSEVFENIEQATVCGPMFGYEL